MAIPPTSTLSFQAHKKVPQSDDIKEQTGAVPPTPPSPVKQEAMSKMQLAAQIISLRKKRNNRMLQKVKLEIALNRARYVQTDTERDVQRSEFNLGLIREYARLHFDSYQTNLRNSGRLPMEKSSFERALISNEYELVRAPPVFQSLVDIEQIEEETPPSAKEIDRIACYKSEENLNQMISELLEENRVESQCISGLQQQIFDCKYLIQRLKRQNDYLAREKDRVSLIGKQYQQMVDNYFKIPPSLPTNRSLQNSPKRGILSAVKYILTLQWLFSAIKYLLTFVWLRRK